jgi:hypothetical protein
MRINLTTPLSDDKEMQRRNEVILAEIERYTEKHMNDDHTATSQPTQSEAVVKLLETMRERCTHPCRSEKAELGCDCDAARQAAVILRQPTQSDALRDQLLQECLVKLRDVQGTEAPKQYACNLIKRIERVLQEQSK